MSRRSSQRFRKGQKGRPVNGILLLDKPAGVTSNAALQSVKKLFEAAKAGHTGSLDPLATGLLPICFGQATKLSGFFLESDKRYRATLTLGATTDTGDRDGTVLETSDMRPDGVQAVERVLARFRGDIEQVPPMYSAIKRNGQPLYKLARQGIEVEREPRPVTVHALELVDLDTDSMVIDLHCSHGFYVRTLAEDIGLALGCGAHVSVLRRIAVADLDVSRALTLEQLEAMESHEQRDQHVISGDSALSHIPEVNLGVNAAFYLCRGQAVKATGLPKSGWVRLYARDTGFLGLGCVTEDGKVAPKRLLTGG